MCLAKKEKCGLQRLILSAEDGYVSDTLCPEGYGHRKSTILFTSKMAKLSILNDSKQDCFFHLMYFRNKFGLEILWLPQK